MAKLWSTKDLLGRDNRDILVFHHRMKHFTLKPLQIFSKMGIITKNLIKVRKLTALHGLYIFRAA